MSTELFETIIKDPQVISTNNAYLHPVRKCNDGRYRSYVCKSPELKALQDFYKEILEDKIDDAFVKELKEYVEADKMNTISLDLVFYLPRNEFFEHDVSNFIKAVEDCLSNRLKIDDSRNSSVKATKEVSLDGSWYLKITIIKSKVMEATVEL